MNTAARAGTKLELQDISKYYGDNVVLETINLTVSEGEFVSLVGPSGCGKTTLLRIIHGLISPTSGEVYIDSKPVHGPGWDRGFVFQADSLMPWRTVLDNVVIGLEIQGRNRRESAEIGRELLKRTSLAGFESHYPWQLSGGMRQRVNLARALAISPSVLLMDEPFAALDAQTREMMQADLLRIWQQERKTVLFITHQIDEAVYLSDRVIVLGRRPGRIRRSLAIDIERPRTLAVKRTQRFTEYVNEIWSLLELDIRESFEEAMR